MCNNLNAYEDTVETLTLGEGVKEAPTVFLIKSDPYVEVPLVGQIRSIF